ncbi:MAG: pyridoxal phosphate-dependent aminotransferase [Candidatus Omnitrophota bacterium]|nr:MAG: pyridoxal phosphate-dependent aminotransferase [Candidatus Omnitrophota bacterium]
MNPRIICLNQSSTLKITALTKKLRQQGRDVINFAAGEPDFDTPSFIKDAAKKAIDSGFTKYTPSRGTVILREKIAAKLQQENKIPVTAENIIVTSGAKYAVFVAIFGLIKEADEVILPSPYWVSYPEMVKLAAGTLKVLPTKASDNFKIKIEDLEKAITSRSKVLILNYPNNPTGATYSYEELQEIYKLVRKRGIFVISDEIYEKLVYDGSSHVSFASFDGAADFTVTINGFSKTYSMTGWRIGYLAAAKKIIDEISKMIDHTTSCTSSISQKGAEAALGDKEWQEVIKKEFQQRWDILWQGLSSCPKLKPIKSQGTFYMFCDISQTHLTSEDFASRLLEEHLVSCIPAESFGAPGFLRLSFATSVENIKKGIDRIKKFISQL